MDKKLTRSRKNRVIGGVAAGIGEYLNIDVIIVRVLFIITAFFSGFSILLYIVLWIIVPEADIQEYFDDLNDKSKEDFSNLSFKEKADNSKFVIGFIFIALGLFFLMKNVFHIFFFQDILPFIFIAVGILLLWNTFKKTNKS